MGAGDVVQRGKHWSIRSEVPGHPKNGVVKAHRFIMTSLPLQRWTLEGQDLQDLALT